MTTFDIVRLVQITQCKDLEQFILDHKWCWFDEQSPIKVLRHIVANSKRDFKEGHRPMFATYLSLHGFDTLYALHFAFNRDNTIEFVKLENFKHSHD